VAGCRLGPRVTQSGFIEASHKTGSAQLPTGVDGDLDDDWLELPSARRARAAGAHTPLQTAPPPAEPTREDESPHDGGVRAAPSGSPAAGPRAAHPNQLLQAARACLRRGRTRDAAILMELACNLAPLDVRCQALLAWLRMQRGEARPAAVGNELVQLLTRAVRLHPNDLELRIYRARALQRLGRDAEAQNDFAFVADADPCNTEAASELRRYRLCASDNPAASGVFSPNPASRSTLPPPPDGVTRGGAAAHAPFSRRAPARAESMPAAPDRHAVRPSDFCPARPMRRSG
jgi:hypothetical protein